MAENIILSLRPTETPGLDEKGNFNEIFGDSPKACMAIKRFILHLSTVRSWAPSCHLDLKPPLWSQCSIQIWVYDFTSEPKSKDAQTNSRSSSAVQKQAYMHSQTFSKTTTKGWSSHHYAQDQSQAPLNDYRMKEGKHTFREYWEKKGQKRTEKSVKKQAAIQLLRSYSQVKIYSLWAQELPGKCNLLKPEGMHHNNFLLKISVATIGL